MLEVLQVLLSGGLIFGICYVSTIIGKCIVAAIISHNKNLTNQKAKYLTKMMSNDININMHQ